MGKTVVLDWEGVDGRFLFKGDQAYHGPAHAFRHELSLRDTWFLVDAKRPPDVNAITLLTTSPRHDLIHAARPLYPGVVPELVEELYAKWGGSVRYVLQFAIIPSLQLHLQQAIDGASLHELLVSVGQLDSKREVSHRLVHIEVGEDYIQHRINFASPYVGQLVGDRLARDSVEAVERFLRWTRDLKDVAAMRGILFERLSHHLMYSREFDMEERDLEIDAHLPKYHNSPKERIDLATGASLEKLKDKPGAYIIPRARDYAPIDSLILPNRAFQCTVSAMPPVESVGLKCMLDETGADEILLTFVVPPDQFATFKKQDLTGMQYNELRRVKQRVCQLPVNI
ncbi:hypothetical protein WJX72_007160 [[Myrmecia] bisecta]|uniref:Uncharacterized protein n=1 Tax=[Myrmecia] bisecta TaxID=41462 RepID=A0AAW1QBM4_9CHLO